MIQTKPERRVSALIILFIVAGLFQSCDNKRKPVDSLQSSEFDKCISNFVQEEIKIHKKLQETYYEIDQDNGAIQVGRGSIFKKGLEGRASVLILHGILTFPRRLDKLINEIHQSGYTVYAPLIPGFGSSTKIANRFKIDFVRPFLDIQYLRLSKCFEEINLIGFSLGGALVTDFVLSRYHHYYAKSRHAKVKSLALLSPSIRPRNYHAAKFSKMLACLYKEEISLSLLSKITNNGEIAEMKKKPDVHCQSFPLNLGGELVKLANQLQKSKRPQFDLHPLPTNLYYSELDQSADWRASREFITETFEEVKIRSFSINDDLPHGLNINKDDEYGEEIRRDLLELISL